MDFIDYDMEDRVLLSASNPNVVEDVEGDELEEVQDWSKLQDLSKKQKTKKKLNKSGLKAGNTGGKEFQPLNDTLYDGSNLQKLRSIMFDTLAAKRGVQSPISQVNQTTIFYNSFLNKCYMFSPKGTFLKTMGRTDKFKRCWLENEELLYLIERGTCLAKDDSGVVISEGNLEISEEHSGFEMSLEEVYSLLIRTESEYDEYCVYSNLKRLGYILMRSSQSDGTDSFDENRIVQNSSHMTSEEYSNLRQSISQNLSILLLNNFKNLLCRPLIPFFKYLSGFLIRHQYLSSSIFNPDHFLHTFHQSYSTIFDKLRIISSGLSIPLNREQHLSQFPSNSIDTNSAYSSFTFDAWKPTLNFSKKTPPLPDYQICVININKSKFPTLKEINNLISRSDHTSNKFKDGTTLDGPKFADLKDGYRNIIIAVVDHGVINYMNLKELDFIAHGSVYSDQEGNKSKSKSNAKRKKNFKVEKNISFYEKITHFFKNN